MDYVQLLKKEASEAHSIFHQYALAVSKSDASMRFFFFEGEEDPSFYMQHIAPRVEGRLYELFTCNGRASVLKACELVEGDGRGNGRIHFFVDKDHSDLMGDAASDLSNSVFQTLNYSIENYLVGEEVFRRYWSERLRLSMVDERYSVFTEKLSSLLNDFYVRCRLLMAAVLLGRGIDGRPQLKLNLNNVQLERVFRLDLDAGKCRFRQGALRHFIASALANGDLRGVSIFSLRSIYEKHLGKLAPKTYVRGKYELWIFYKFISHIARQLCDREKARASGVRRASALGVFGYEACMTNLCALVACPDELRQYLDAEVVY